MPEREWKGNTAGTTWMHRWLIHSLRVLPLRMVYAGAAVFVIPFCMLFAHKGYISMYHFFRRRLGQKPLRAFRNTYINHCRFAQVIIDRFYIYGGGKFDFEIENDDLYQRLAAGKEGFVILSAHIGNYEAAGYMLVAKTKRFNALVYGGEAQTVMQNRKRILTQNNIRMIPIQEDMSHLFAMSNALADGESVSIPADRIFGSPRYVECRLFGKEARLPLGPFSIAAQREVPVITIHVMKESARKYHIYIRQLKADGTTLKERSESLARQYATNLERTIENYPTQWFNYYEFWDEH